VIIKFQPRHKLAAHERNLDRFRFWLQGYEAPDPAKAAQYARWRLVRSSLHQGHAAPLGHARMMKRVVEAVRADRGTPARVTYGRGKS
jgi:hypothetical protein